MPKFFIITVVAALFLSGCSSSVGRKSETKNKFNKIRFEERATRTVVVDSTANRIAMNIYRLPEVVQVNFPLDRNSRVLSLSLIENEKLNIDRHLLWDREYVVDDAAGVLSVQFEFPAIYLLDQIVRFGLRIVTIDSKSKKVTAIEKTLSFSWAPMKGGSEKLSFEYGDIDMLKAQISPQLRTELELTDIGRFSPIYGSKLRQVLK